MSDDQTAALMEAIERLEGKVDALAIQRSDREWYTLGDFAKAVGLSVDRVRKWCQSGRVEASKRQCGRSGYAEWQVSRAELDRYLDHGLRPGAAQAGSR